MLTAVTDFPTSPKLRAPQFCAFLRAFLRAATGPVLLSYDSFVIDNDEMCRPLSVLNVPEPLSLELYSLVCT